MLDSKLAAPQGFEPRYADPESAVLPLNEGAATVMPGWFTPLSAWAPAERRTGRANRLMIRALAVAVKPPKTPRVGPSVAPMSRISLISQPFLDANSQSGEAKAPSASCARPDTMRRPTAEWASACSTTSPSRRDMRSAATAWSACCIVDWDVHHGNGTQDIFLRRSIGVFLQHAPVALVSGHWRRRRDGRRRGAREHAQLSLRGGCRARSDSGRVSRPVGDAHG